jgi:hypothetical protein
LKDWWVGTSDYVNDLYTVTLSGGNGLQLVSSDGKISKTVTLGAYTNVFEVSYTLSGDLADEPLYVRNGLSPDLMNLLVKGQSGMTESLEGGVLRIATTGAASAVSVAVGANDGVHTAVIKEDAVDDNPGEGIEFYTVNMRNQAQVDQVEVYGTGNFSFSLAFSADGAPGETVQRGFILMVK